MKTLIKFYYGDSALNCYIDEDYKNIIENLAEQELKIGSMMGEKQYWTAVTDFVVESNPSSIVCPDFCELEWNYLVEVILTENRLMRVDVYNDKYVKVDKYAKINDSPRYSLIYYKESERRNNKYVITEILEQDSTHLKCICEGKGYRNFKTKNIVSLKKI